MCLKKWSSGKHEKGAQILQKEQEIVKKNQVKLPEMKNTIIGILKLLERLKSRLSSGEEKKYDLEPKEIIQNIAERKRGRGKKEIMRHGGYVEKV